MIRSYTFLLCSLFLSTATAQSWCPPGAEWTHRIFHQGSIGNPPLNGYNITRYSGDTMIDGVIAQKLDRWEYREDPDLPGSYDTFDRPPLFTRSDTDMVFLWVEADQAFDTLYWFAAQPGDHWGMPNWSNAEFHVLSVVMVLQDGEELRQMIVEPQISGSPLPLDTIVERIGSYRYYIDPSISQLLSMIGYIEKVKCYRDVEIDFSRTPGTECGFTVGLPDLQNSAVVLYPNPGTDHFTLQLPSGDHHLKILDQLGRSVMQIDRVTDQAVIGTASLLPGIYTLHITDRNGRALHQRWVKQ